MESIHFRSQGLADGDESLQVPDGNPVDSMEGAAVELVAGDRSAIEEIPL